MIPAWLPSSPASAGNDPGSAPLGQATSVIDVMRHALWHAAPYVVLAAGLVVLVAWLFDRSPGGQAFDHRRWVARYTRAVGVPYREADPDVWFQGWACDLCHGVFEALGDEPAEAEWKAGYRASAHIRSHREGWR